MSPSRRAGPKEWGYAINDLVSFNDIEGELVMTEYRMGIQMPDGSIPYLFKYKDGIWGHRKNVAESLGGKLVSIKGQIHWRPEKEAKVEAVTEESMVEKDVQTDT